MAPRPPGAPFQAQATTAMQNRPMQGVPGLTQLNAPAQMQRTGSNSMNPLTQPVGPIHGSVNPSAQLPQATPVTPTQRPSSGTFNAHTGTPGSSTIASIPSADSVSSISQSDENVLDQDVQGIKRKMEFEEGGNKRARQKTGKSPFNPVLTVLNQMHRTTRKQHGTLIYECSIVFPMFNGICSCLLPQGNLPKNRSDSLCAERLNMFLSRVRLIRMAVEI